MSYVDEILTIRVPKGTRRSLERRAKAEQLSVSQYVRRALENEALIDALKGARRGLVAQARAKHIFTDDDVFDIVS